MNGNLTVFDSVSDQNVGGAITGLVPYTGTPSPGDYETGIYEYNDLLYSNAPELDMYGLVFTVSGFNSPLELCEDPYCKLSSGIQVWLWDLEQVSSSYPYAGKYGTYYAFPVTFSAPEPSVLALLTLGLLG